MAYPAQGNGSCGRTVGHGVLTRLGSERHIRNVDRHRPESPGQVGLYKWVEILERHYPPELPDPDHTGSRSSGWCVSQSTRMVP